MKKLLFSTFIASLTLLGFSQSAMAAETGTVAGVWTCSFLPGKDMEDLTTWRDFYAAQLEELDSEEAQSVSAFMWTPRFSGAEVDLVWFEYHENLNVSSRAIAAYDASGIGAAVDGMWESIVDCQSSQSFRRQIYAGDRFNVTPPVIVESFRCVFNPGMGYTEVEDALGRWSSVLDELPQTDEFVAYMFTPFHSAIGFDVSFYGVYDNIIDYGAMTTDYLTSSSGQQMDARWREIQKCESRLWNANRMM